MNVGELLGYDPSLLRRLAAADRSAIEWLAAGWLLSCGLLACPIAYAAWLVTHSALLAAAVGCGCLGLVIAVLRLTIAGGGAAPHHALAMSTHDPSAGPAVLIGVLALLFAQPAQLPLLHAELEAPVAQHRRALLERHVASAQAAGMRAGDTYAEELARCEFVSLRLQHAWQSPARALRYTLIYCLLVIFPSLAARTGARSALRRYERERVRGQRRVIRRSAAAAQAELEKLLSAYPSYRPGGGVPLDPFQVAEPHPLRTAPGTGTKP